MKHVYILMAVMAGVTYAIRAIPLVAFRKKIRSRYIQSLLYYIPYAVLTAMTIPAVFYSAASLISSLVGCAVALLLAWKNRSMLVVAIAACAAAYITEWLLTLL